MTPAGIYLTGEAGAGKTTAAAILADLLGSRVYHLTAPLYAEARRRGAVGRDRLALQQIGDELRARWGQDWLAVAVTEAAGRDGATLAIVDDVRLVAEGLFLSRQGWSGLRLAAPAEVRRRRLLARDGRLPPAGWEAHGTETEVGRVPVVAVVSNDGSLSDLRTQLEQLARDLGWCAEPVRECQP